MPRRNDLVVLSLYLTCPHGHRLGSITLDADTSALRLVPSLAVSGHRIDTGEPNPGEPIHHEDGRLRYLCGRCLSAARSGHAPRPERGSVSWRTVASIAAALACWPEGNLNRTVPATRAALVDSWRALTEGRTLTDQYRDHFAAWRHGPTR